MARAGRDDKVIIGQPHIRQDDFLRAGVDVGNRAEDGSRIGLTAENAADRAGDIGRRQARRGDLVEERLEKMIVAAIDDGDVRRAAAERPRRAQAAKSGAENDDARPPVRGLVGPTAGIICKFGLCWQRIGCFEGVQVHASLQGGTFPRRYMGMAAAMCHHIVIKSAFKPRYR